MSMTLGSLLGGAGSGTTSSPSGDSGASAPSPTDHPMVRLGLVNPDGSSRQASQAGTDNNPETADSTGDGEQQQQIDWDSADNPYKSKVSDLESRLRGTTPTGDPRVTLAQQQQQIESQASNMLQQLMSGPVAQGRMDANVANVITNLAKHAALANAQLESERAVLLPAARREVADRVAKQYSTGKVTIDPKELLDEPSVDAMTARAKTLSEQRRDKAFQARKASGADRVESGGGNGRIDESSLRQLSPSAKIKLGIMRGHTGNK